MQITNHKFDGVPYMRSPNHSGGITPKFLVMHYTAGFSSRSALSWLTNPIAKASAHIVLDNDGQATQLVPFNVAAWHAGASKHGEYTKLNHHSIGIEITNVGFLRKVNNGYVDWNYAKNRKIYREGEGDLAGRELVQMPHKRAGGGMLYWPTYTEAQLEALDRIVPALIDAYDLTDIVTHEEIDTRGWKVDPGPAFPMNRYTRLLGRSDGDAAPVNATGPAPVQIMPWRLAQIQGHLDSAKEASEKLAHSLEQAEDRLNTIPGE